MSSPLDNDDHVRHVLETSRTFIEANDKLGLSPWAGYAYLVEFRKKHNIKMLPLEVVPGSDRIACKAWEVPDEIADAIANSKMDPEFDYLNTRINK